MMTDDNGNRTAGETTMGVKEAASRLGLHRSVVLGLARTGHIKGEKRGASHLSPWDLERASVDAYLSVHGRGRNKAATQAPKPDGYTDELTAKRAAKVLGVDSSYIGKLVKQERLVGHVADNGRTLFVTRASVEKYAAERVGHAHRGPQAGLLRKSRQQKEEAMRARQAEPPAAVVAAAATSKSLLARIEDRLVAIEARLDQMIQFWQ